MVIVQMSTDGTGQSCGEEVALREGAVQFAAR